MRTRSDHNRCAPGEVLFILIYSVSNFLFTNIFWYSGFGLRIFVFLHKCFQICFPYFRKLLNLVCFYSSMPLCAVLEINVHFTITSIVVKVINSYFFHKKPLGRVAVGLKLLFKIVSAFISCFSNLHPKFVYLVKLLL